MNRFKDYLLLEISLKDHFEKYVKGKMEISQEDYEKIAKLDPTTKGDQRGKYVELLLRLYKSDKAGFEEHSSELPSLFLRYVKNTGGVNINTMKTPSELYDYLKTLPEESKNQIAAKAKDPLRASPDDIEIIDETSEWICILTKTKKGNILGAQWRTNPQAKWCTAYLNTDSHWDGYSNSGELIQFLNKKDPYDKYQIHVKTTIDSEHVIAESRDYNDHTSNFPITLIEDELNNFEKNYAKIRTRVPFKFIWDEESAVYYLLDSNFERANDYLNREPEEDEYDFYYEEAMNNEEFQINHWDRFLTNIFEYFNDSIVDDLVAYKNDNVDKRAKWRIEDYLDRCEHISSYFKTPITGDAEDKEPAKEAVEDFYEEFEEEWVAFNNKYKSYDDDEMEAEFRKEFYNWFIFVEYFIADFPHKFDFSIVEIKDPNQMEFDFKEALKSILNQKVPKNSRVL